MSEGRVRVATQRPGTGLPVEAIAGELRKILAAHGPALQPDDLLRVARDPRSVLHSFFGWGLGVGSEAFRLSQARCLLAIVGAGRIAR